MTLLVLVEGRQQPAKKPPSCSHMKVMVQTLSSVMGLPLASMVECAT